MSRLLITCLPLLVFACATAPGPEVRPARGGGAVSGEHPEPPALPALTAAPAPAELLSLALA
jgi:hypothetical protein